jgi:type VI secretion system protein ImpL
MALALQAINGLQQELAQQASLPPGGGTTAAPANDPLLALRAVAGQAPMPVQRWLLGLAESGAALHAGGTRQQAAAALSGAGGPAQLCEKAVAGRYPFMPTAASDVPLEDFARLFAPGGLIDGFFVSELRPFANTTGPVWKAQVVAGTPAPITTSELAPFQRAAKIRDAFFPAGATAPSVHFTITPTELDANAKQVTLDLGDSSLSYAHGPQRPVQVTWPGQGAATARLVFDPPAANGAALQASGPWALFRLFARGRLEAQGGSDSYTLTFQEGERRVVFAIRTGSVVTPLSPGLLQGFRCPAIR